MILYRIIKMEGSEEDLEKAMRVAIRQKTSLKASGLPNVTIQCIDQFLLESQEESPFVENLNPTSNSGP